jgi:hypothetical protein
MIFFAVLGMEPRASLMLGSGQVSTTELSPQPSV